MALAVMLSVPPTPPSHLAQLDLRHNSLGGVSGQCLLRALAALPTAPSEPSAAGAGRASSGVTATSAASGIESATSEMFKVCSGEAGSAAKGA